MKKQQCPKCGATPQEFFEFYSSTIIWKALPNGLAAMNGQFELGYSTHIEAVCSECGWQWKIDNIFGISDLQHRGCFVEGISDNAMNEMQWSD